MNNTILNYPMALPLTAQFDPELAYGAGDWIDLYINFAQCRSPMTPPLFHESAALFLASMAISRRIKIDLGFGPVYPNLFILWMAPTTIYRKTTGLNVGKEIARTALPHLLAPQDTTPEAILSDMAGHKPKNYDDLTPLDQDLWNARRNFAAQQGIIRDELSGLLAGAGREYNAGLLEAFLNFYDCEPIYTRSTLSGGLITVRNAYLSLLGASTPTAMAQHFEAERLWGNGWWPRFAILTPDDSPDWSEPITPEPEDFTKLCQGLARLSSDLPGATWPNAPQTLEAQIAYEAKNIWNRYNKALTYDMLQDGSTDQKLFGAYGRLPTQALKVGMILAALDWRKGTPLMIEVRHMARAIGITESWRASVHRAIEITFQTEENHTSERIRRILAMFDIGGASVNEIHRQMQDKRPSEIEMSLDDMRITGEVEEIKQENPGPGRPTKRYRLITE